ncbi:MAG: GspE/PulE family protein [Clostridium chrysemydis]|uniref:GspE/PulE family protein n=1 Tax=Clostridium chrysemydis TaxID=2665504 RepID=UPI003F30C3FA
MKKKRLGDILVESQKISHEVLMDSLKKQAMTGKRLGEILVETGVVKEEDILKVLELQLGIKRISLEFEEVQIEAIRRVPERLSRKHSIMPVEIRGNNIVIVTSDPFNLMADEDIRLASGMNLIKVLDTKDSILDSINKYYSKQMAEKVASELGAEAKAFDKTVKKEEVLEEASSDAPVVKLVDTIITNAVRMGASDIHIEPFEKDIRVRVRVDGELQNILTVPKESQSTLTTRIKILSNMNIAEKRVPQDGRILKVIDNKKIDFRVSSLPTVNGEKVVIRILSTSMGVMTKENLGMRKDDMEKLVKIMQNPYGIILVTGPTGSGKSTTLYTILSELNTIDKNIITVEDPVEFMVEGINQVNVNTKAGMTFASGLRSILRQDPDIIMLGEIRDSETAEISIRAAITGHVVLSTLHTNDAPSTIARLSDMGIEPYLVATSVTGVVAQRLVRKVCTHCSEKYEANDFEKRVLGKDSFERVYLSKGEGCPLCNGTGYKGRIGIYEIMEVSRAIREAVTLGETADKIKDIAINEGMKTLNKACREHVIEGVTTIDELMRVAYLRE